MNSRRGLARSAPRRQAIENGETLLDRQMTPNASGFREIPLDPSLIPNFGGGTSPIKTNHTIHIPDQGRLTKWESDGYVTLSILVDPPVDGRVYGTQNGKWVPLPFAPGTAVFWDEAGITWDETGVEWDTGQPVAARRAGNGAAAHGPVPVGESPLDGRGYVRVGLNQAWAPAFTQAQADARYAPIATVSFAEPPDDGQAYARRGWDRSWVAVATGEGVPEAPPDGGSYTRCGADETWRPAFTQAQADARYATLSQVSGVIYDAPNNTNVYARSGGAWVLALTESIADTLYAPRSTVGFPEAPMTKKRLFARRGSDQSWQPAAGEAPTDGQSYVRRGKDGSWQPALTQSGADSRYAPVVLVDQVENLMQRIAALEGRLG